VAATAAAAAGGRTAAAPAIAGTYRLAGTGRVEAAPFPARDEALHADTVVSPGPGPRAVGVELAVDAFRCAVRATVDEAGTLAFSPGQRCPVGLGALGEGHAEATLRAGTGLVRGGALELRLAFDPSGRVRVRGGGALDALGRALSLPGAGWTDVSGVAEGQASGRLDASRAADAPPPPSRTP
jgi:hypothetical protein